MRDLLGYCFRALKSKKHAIMSSNNDDSMQGFEPTIEKQTTHHLKLQIVKNYDTEPLKKRVLMFLEENEKIHTCKGKKIAQAR